MSAARLDREEFRRRLSPDTDGWVVDELLDSFEPAYLSFQRRVAEAEKKRKSKAQPRKPQPRLGREATDTEPGGDA